MNCWICQERIADSSEHKFKASDLKRHYGKVYKESMLFIFGEKEKKLQGNNSELLKFQKVICSVCNNDKTSEHDKAYDLFAIFILNSYDKLLLEQKINFFEIFGNNWIIQKRNLYRYFAKHAGCKIVTGETQYNVNDLACFINGNDNSDTFRLHFQLKEGIKVFSDVIHYLDNNSEYAHIYNGPTIVFKENQLDSLSYFGWTSYQWISTNWVVSDYIENQNKIDFNSQYESVEIKYFRDCDEFSDEMGYEKTMLNIEHQGIINESDIRLFYKKLIS